MLNRLRSRISGELEHLSHLLVVELETQAQLHPEQESTRALQQRVHLLGQLLAGLSMIHPEMVSLDRAGYGSLIGVREIRSGVDHLYTLMAGPLIELEEGQVSVDSPIGQALLGSRPGDRIAVETPSGMRELEVHSLLTLPQRLGLADPEDAAAALVAELQPV